tara:strand:+ start:130 stop:306 length:177 start_codon:yes stop_codon:yes gene_type:complete
MEDFTEDLTQYVREPDGKKIGSNLTPKDFPYDLKKGARVVAKSNGQTIVEINGEFLTV